MRNITVILAAICAVAVVFFAVKMWAADGEPLAVGTAAPGFTLASQSGAPVSLAEFKGRWVVLYFYPKDKTPGCTIEAHNFQRDAAKYEAAKAAVLGVSLDTAESHASFCTQEGLHFKLLADPEHTVVDAYHVPVKNAVAFKFASRWTYLIDPQGKIAKVWTKVDVQTHSEEVLAAIAAGK